MIFKYFLDFIPLCTKKSNTVKTNVFDVTEIWNAYNAAKTWQELLGYDTHPA